MRERFTVPGLLALSMLMLLCGPAGSQIVDPGHPADSHHKAPARPEFDCLDCHECENPTREEPCMGICPRHAHHFVGTHQADEGPDIVIIDQLANLYEPVVFSHGLHARMSAMTGGCENCHHYSEASGTVPPCRECHDATKNPVSLQQPALKGAYHRQCINCHLDWSNENSCGFCHEQADAAFATSEPDTTDIVGIPHPKIAAKPTYNYETDYENGHLVSFHHNDHVDLFGQQCVDCHRGDSCKRCHEPNHEQRASVSQMTTCCACHGEKDCAFCHSDVARPIFQHAVSTGWDLDPHHDEVSCVVCHGEPKEFRTPSHRCVSCHIHWEEGSFDHQVTGLVLSEDHIDLDCDSCHLEMDFAKPPSCEDCHDEPMFPEQLPGRRVKR